MTEAIPPVVEAHTSWSRTLVDSYKRVTAVRRVPASGITAYDVANRVASANISGGEVRYSYGPGNKRVWRGTWVSGSQTVDEITFYSAGGAKLCAYNLSVSGSDLRATVSGNYYEYFGGKLLKNAQGWVNQDRLGSFGKFYPYGQERPSATGNGKEKFATYFRDSETGLDYAQNRYHSAGDGRFLTADPYQASAGVETLFRPDDQESDPYYENGSHNQGLTKAFCSPFAQ